MWHVGIDLHRATVVLAAVNDAGEATHENELEFTLEKFFEESV